MAGLLKLWGPELFHVGPENTISKTLLWPRPVLFCPQIKWGHSMITPTTHFNLFSPPSGVHDPTTSYSPFLFHHNAAATFCHLMTKMCHSCYYYDKWAYLTQPTKLTKTSLYLSKALSLKTENSAF